MVDDLQKKSEQNPEFTWTGISTGLFFDLVCTLSRRISSSVSHRTTLTETQNLELGIFGFDAKAKKATVVDSGNEPFQTSNKALVAKAVAGVLKKPQETANKYLSVASFQTTHNQILQIVEELTGSKWTVERQDTAELQKIGEEKLAKGDFSAFGQLLRVYLYRDGAGHPLKEEDKANKLLGIPEEEDVKESLQKWLTWAGAINGKAGL